MMAASLRSTAVAAGGIILLCAEFAGIGAMFAPTDWPVTTGAFNEHILSSTIGYAAWGVAIALGLEAIRHLVQSLRARRLNWRLLTLIVSFEVVLTIAVLGTLPVCSFCNDLSAMSARLPMVTFSDEVPQPSGSTVNTPSSHQDDLSR